MAKYIIPNLKNACEVLKHLSASPIAKLASEISKDLKLPKTSLLRILKTLEDENFILKTDAGYILGGSLIQIGNCAVARSNLTQIAQKYLNELTSLTGETSHIGLYADKKVLIAKVCQSQLSLHATSRAGSLVNMHCSGTGKVLLAYLKENQREWLKKINLEKRTNNTITTYEGLLTELDKIKEDTYAVDNEEFHEGIRCLACPIRDISKEVVAAIGITAPAIRFKQEDIENMARIVKSYATKIEKDLGI